MQDETLDLGPIAVDHRSTSGVVYFIKDSTLYRVDLSVDSAATKFNYKSMGESATAMTFNTNYSMVTIFSHTDATIAAIHFNLESQKSSIMNFHGYNGPVDTAILMPESLILGHSAEDLLLIDLTTGLSSFVFERTTLLPPLNTTDSGHDKIKVKRLAGKKNQTSLLALDLDLNVIKLEYTGRLNTS
jgi:hypothetical protein